MKKLLKFMFYTVYQFYERRSFNEDSEDFAFPFICGWLYLLIIFLGSLICNILGINYFFWEEDPKLKFLALLPGIIIFIIGWRNLISNDGYKEWIKPELFEKKIYTGWSGTILFWALFFFPFLIAVIVGLTIPR